MHLSNSYYEYGDKYRYVWGRILYLLLVLSVFFSCILFFIIWNTFDNLEFSNRFLLALLSVFSLQFNANNLIGQQLYTLRGTPIPFVSRTLIGGLIGITTTFVSIRYFKMGYLGFVLGSALNYMFCFFSLFVRCGWKRNFIQGLKFQKQELLTYWRFRCLLYLMHWGLCCCHLQVGL